MHYIPESVIGRVMITSDMYSTATTAGLCLRSFLLRGLQVRRAEKCLARRCRTNFRPLQLLMCRGRVKRET